MIFQNNIDSNEILKKVDHNYMIYEVLKINLARNNYRYITSRIKEYNKSKFILKKGKEN